MSEEDDVELWRRARRSVKLVGALAVGCVLVLLTVPVAVALEDTTTSTTDTLTADDPLEPSEDTSTLDTVEDDGDGTVDSTLDAVDETDDTDTLEPVTDTTREVLLEPEEEPSASDDGQNDDPGTTDDGDEQEGDGDAAATTGDDGGEQAGDEGSDPVADAQPSGSLSADPVGAAGARRPFTPASAAAPSDGEAGGPDPALLAKMTEPGERWGGQTQGSVEPPPSLGVSPYAADVVVPLGPRSTRDILDTLGGDAALFGEVARILAPFPVAGPAQYSDDFGAPRHIPEYHPHEGTDVFAPRGTPVIASADGTIGGLAAGTAIGGNSLKVYTADGSYFYYSHLDGFAPGIANGTTVELGQVIGYVGDTGNAVGTPPHLHFEIHPGGGEAVNPLPYLDRWLANARAAAGSLADANSVVMEPQVAPPADAPAGATSQQQAEAATSPQATAPVQPDQDLIGAESDTSPMSLLILIGAATVLFLMMRRPETDLTGTPAPSAGASPAASFPSARPEVALELLPVPGDAVEAEEEDEFEWITLGA